MSPRRGRSRGAAARHDTEAKNHCAAVVFSFGIMSCSGSSTSAASRAHSDGVPSDDGDPAGGNRGKPGETDASAAGANLATNPIIQRSLPAQSMAYSEKPPALQEACAGVDEMARSEIG